MNGNPVNRLAATLGLMALAAIAYGVAMGTVEMTDAAVRAGMTLGAVIAVRVIGRLGMSLLADSMERQAVTENPQRRAGDADVTPTS